MLKKIFVFFSLLLIPTIVLAAEEYVYDVTLIPESLENILELVIMLIAVLSAVFAIKLAALSQGGELEKTWNMIAIAAGLFAVLEVHGALSGFKLVHLGGFAEIIELLFGLVLLATVYKTRKFLLKKVMGK